MDSFDDFSYKPQSGTKDELIWGNPKDNPRNLRLLDLRPFTQGNFSVTRDPKMAENAVSYGNEDGKGFWGISPKNSKTVESRLRYPIDAPLQAGVFFTPRVMEQKWAIFFDGINIIFVRSWQREVQVVAKTRQETDRLIIESVTGEFLENETPESMDAFLNFLLITHALNEIVPTPIPKEMENVPEIVGHAMFSLYGEFAHFGVFDETFLSRTKKTRLRTLSLLHIAAARDDIEDVVRLAGSIKNLNYLAKDGGSPLHWSLVAETPAAMKKLLELGADPNVRSDEGVTPLMNTAQDNATDRALLLIQSGAELDAADNRGFTALHRACEMGFVEMVALLLKHGADKTMAAGEHTALSLAKLRNEQKIIDMLMS